MDWSKLQKPYESRVDAGRVADIHGCRWVGCFSLSWYYLIHARLLFCDIPHLSYKYVVRLAYVRCAVLSITHLSW